MGEGWARVLPVDPASRCTVVRAGFGEGCVPGNPSRDLGAWCFFVPGGSASSSPRYFFCWVLLVPSSDLFPFPPIFNYPKPIFPDWAMASHKIPFAPGFPFFSPSLGSIGGSCFYEMKGPIVLSPNGPPFYRFSPRLQKTRVRGPRQVSDVLLVLGPDLPVL